MAKDIDAIIRDIETHIYKTCGGGNYSEYYIGLTKNLKEGLFGGHSVPQKGHCYFFCAAYNYTDAREIENYFLNKGMQGGDEDGESENKIVCVYKIASLCDKN